MKITTTLAVALATLSSCAYAAQSYDAFYSAQPGAVFGDPIPFDPDPVKKGATVVYSYPGKPGVFTALRARLNRRTLDIEVWKDQTVINGKAYRFANARKFPGEHVSDIFPESAEVFVASSTSSHPPLLCIEGHGNASGEAGSRYTQISLLIDPLARKPTFLHLPSLLSSCRGVRMLNNGKLAFPSNSYLYDEAREARVGLLMSYYTFEDRRFVPALNEIRLLFKQPEIPFQFSVQE
ncbi:hypothetical protein [Cupriavidus sp. BIS7]|uniref:hypothetical protein n=1 Tax=Cupriavidus sp. BIS7 TaxID=1217718 RepID=UPI000374C438|nr:hypothetical protein [Cupriavidus sp. BIS7]